MMNKKLENEYSLGIGICERWNLSCKCEGVDSAKQFYRIFLTPFDEINYQ